MVKTFGQLVQPFIEKKRFRYFADGIEEVPDLEMIIEQLDRFSGITDFDYGHFFEEPCDTISIRLIGSPYLNRTIMSVHAWKGKGDDLCVADLAECIAARSYDDLSLEKEIERAADYIPSQFFCFEKTYSGDLNTFHYAIKHWEINKEQRKLYMHWPWVINGEKGTQLIIKLKKKPTKTKYTSMQEYWEEEIRPVLLDSNDDYEKCRVLSEFVYLTNSLEQKMDVSYEKSCLHNAKRSAKNLIRAIKLNSKQEPGFVKYKIKKLFHKPIVVEVQNPKRMFIENAVIYHLFEDKDEFYMDSPSWRV